MSWHDLGCPIVRNWQIDETLELLRIWYVDYRQLNGGFLHVWIEDGNLDDEQVLPEHAFDFAFADIEPYVAEDHASGRLPTTVTADMIEKHMRRIIGCWRDLDEYERYAAYAWHHGYAQKLLAETARWDAWDATDAHAVQVHPNSTWAKRNKVIETAHGKYTHDVRSGPVLPKPVEHVFGKADDDPRTEETHNR